MMKNKDATLTYFKVKTYLLLIQNINVFYKFSIKFILRPQIAAAMT